MTGIPLTQGGVYWVLWRYRLQDVPVLARYYTNAPDCDEDETPWERWEFFGEGMDCYKIADYEAVMPTGLIQPETN